MAPIVFLAEWALRSSVLIASGAMLLWALRVKDPSIRWAGWTAMLCVSVAIPALTVVLPKLPLAVMPAPHGRLEARTEIVPEPTLEPGHALSRPSRRAGGRDASVSERSDRARDLSRPDVRVGRHITAVSKPFDWALAALMIYILIALALLLRLCFGLVMSLRLLRGSLVTGRATEGIEIRESDHVASPVVLGIARPAIVLPGDWREWGTAKLDAVLAHERSHIRRHDPAWQLLSAIHRALLWHNPLSWFLHWRMVRVAEEVSDDAALALTQDRIFYAELLLDFMQRGVRGPAWQGVPMAHYGPAHERIDRILDGTDRSRGVTRWSIAVILALGFPLAYVVAAALPQCVHVRTLTTPAPAQHYSPSPTHPLPDMDAKITANESGGSMSLLVAAAQGNTDVAKLLLDRGADIEAEDRYSSTPLLRATFGGHLDTVKLLLGKGARTEAKDKDGRTALVMAFQAHNTEMVNLLLEGGAKIDASGNNSPLLWAARENMTEIVKLLLDKGANPEVVDNDGMMPLTVAADAGNIAIVKLLIDKGVHVADYGSTALFRARNIEMLKLLLDNGANVDARDDQGATLLIESVREVKIDVMRLLLDRGADIEAKDREGMTALMWAAFWGKADIVKLLLEKGANIGADDGRGQTALSFAHSGPVRNPEALNLLLGEGTK